MDHPTQAVAEPSDPAETPCRPEAVYLPAVSIDDLDGELVRAVSGLSAAGVPVVLGGFEDAARAVNRFSGGGEGVVVADGGRALSAGGPDAGEVVWDGRRDGPFAPWVQAYLWRLGIGPALVAVGGGGRDVVELLEELAGDRARGALPGIDESDGWCLVIADGDDLPQVDASLLALSDGTVGIPADLEDDPASDHVVLVAGAYGRGAGGLVRPLPGPAVTVLDDRGERRPGRRVLDLHTGVLRRDPDGDGLGTVRFVSLARPGIFALRAEDTRLDVAWPAPLAPPTVTSGLAAELTYDLLDGVDVVRAETVSGEVAVRAVAAQRQWQDAEQRRVERIVSVRSRNADGDVGAGFDAARAAGFDRLLAEHRRAWAQRWEEADIEITGDPVSQLAVRYALFHLLSCAPTEGEAVVGARGLTGLAYAGHVFWDTDVFVLPALAATLPAAARAVLGYRINRLGAAREAAAARGLPGARYPWESADTGRDVTPTSTRDVEGHVVPIRTGEHEEHINADIAWALHHFLEWTGDTQVMDDGGRDVVVDTARCWAASVRLDEAGAGHLYGVIGPDEYHEVVDDNAYTNNMARWHLRWAAGLAAATGDEEAAAAFETAADRLVTGFDLRRGCHEQFAGFWGLEPLLVRDIAEPPVAADLLLGREAVLRSQVVKQPDVLMLHHLLPDACPPGSLRTDLDFYLPRTAHGSSLSPAICAALLARDGRPDDAMHLFDVAAGLDLHDRTGTTAGGLHLATMGGLWQAVVHGFAGVRPTSSGLAIDPHLPRRWEELSVRLHHRGCAVRITVDHDTVDVDADGPVPVIVADRPAVAPVTVAYRPDPGEER